MYIYNMHEAFNVGVWKQYYVLSIWSHTCSCISFDTFENRMV